MTEDRASKVLAGRRTAPYRVAGCSLVPALVFLLAAPTVLRARWVTDETGRRVNIPDHPHRLISLAPSITETLYALGRGDRIVGDTDYCDYPPEAKLKPHVGAVLNPSLEKIVALKPDLVLGDVEANRRETADQLERVGIPLYGFSAHTLDDTLRSVEDLGKVLDDPAPAQTLVASLRQRVEAVERGVAGQPRPKVLFVTWYRPLITAGPDSFVADVVRRAGGVPISDDLAGDWPRISLEEVLVRDPDVILFPRNESFSPGLKEFAQMPGWKDLRAVKEQRMYFVSEAIIHPSPRLVDALEEVARILHPAVARGGGPAMTVAATRRNALGLVLALGAALVLVSAGALTVGGVHLAFRDVWTGFVDAGQRTDAAVIVREIRLPRILLAALVGAALAVSGTVLQALLRNPLADPYVLGISSGAALGEIAALWIGGRVAAASPVAAFAGALLTMAWVYLLGRRGSRLASNSLLLAGIITASFLSAAILFVLTLLSTRDVRGAAYWLMGDLSVVSGVQLRTLVPAVVLAIGALYWFSKDLNVLLLGKEEAAHLGVNVARVETAVYILASLLTGLAVSVSGAIGYLGLLVPHLGRMLVGNDHRTLLPTAALGGAIVLVLSDTLARTVISPAELPVGAVTAVAGAPVFIYLLRRTAG